MSLADEYRYKLKRTTLHGEMECPYCSELIKRTAKVCPYCQTDFEEIDSIARAERAESDAATYTTAWENRYLTIPCGMIAGGITFFYGIDVFDVVGLDMLWVGGGSLIIAFLVYALTMHIIAGILLICILAAIAHFMGWVDVMAL